MPRYGDDHNRFLEPFGLNREITAGGVVVVRYNNMYIHM